MNTTNKPVTLDGLCILALTSDGRIAQVAMTPEQSAIIEGLVTSVCSPLRVVPMTKADGLEVTRSRSDGTLAVYRTKGDAT